MTKPDDKREQPPFNRRPAGKRILQPPTPRPIPHDHPAKSLFSSLPSRSAQSEESPATTLETPTQTPTAATTPTPTSTPTQTPIATPISTPTASPTTPPTVNAQKPVETTSLPRRADSPAAPESVNVGVDEAPRRNEALDSTHTSSEQLVYSYMYRQTISQSIRERHFGPAELMKSTPIRSHVTVRKAIDGLIEKRSIEIVSFVPGSPYGPRYRVYDPREIMRRRQHAGITIDPVTKRILSAHPTPTETTTATPIITPTIAPTETTTATPMATTATPTNSGGATATDSGGVTPTNSGGAILNSRNTGAGSENPSVVSSSESVAAGRNDDEAFTGLVEALKQTAREITGKDPSMADAERWREVGELLANTLQTAASHTTVSSVPAFLAEHLRRRLARPPVNQMSANAPAPTQATTPPRPEPPTDDELVNMFVGFLHDGISLADIDNQFSNTVESERWPGIRARMLERYEQEKNKVGRVQVTVEKGTDS